MLVFGLHRFWAPSSVHSFAFLVELRVLFSPSVYSALALHFGCSLASDLGKRYHRWRQQCCARAASESAAHPGQLVCFCCHLSRRLRGDQGRQVASLDCTRVHANGLATLTYAASQDVASIRGVRRPRPPGKCLQNVFSDVRRYAHPHRRPRCELFISWDPEPSASSPNFLMPDATCGQVTEGLTPHLATPVWLLTLRGQMPPWRQIWQHHLGFDATEANDATF